MSKGNSGYFVKTKGSISKNSEIANNNDYNRAGSLDVEKVKSISKITNHSVSIKGIPNSVSQNHDKKGSLISERYYNDNGWAYLDIDYTNHGNPKTHPDIPHQHKIRIIGNTIKREKGVKIRK